MCTHNVVILGPFIAPYSRHILKYILNVMQMKGHALRLTDPVWEYIRGVGEEDGYRDAPVSRNSSISLLRHWKYAIYSSSLDLV